MPTPIFILGLIKHVLVPGLKKNPMERDEVEKFLKAYNNFILKAESIINRS